MEMVNKTMPIVVKGTSLESYIRAECNKPFNNPNKIERYTAAIIKIKNAGDLLLD